MLALQGRRLRRMPRAVGLHVSSWRSPRSRRISRWRQYDDMQPLLDLLSAAAILGLSVCTLRRAVRAGKQVRAPAGRGRWIRVHRDDDDCRSTWRAAALAFGAVLRSRGSRGQAVEMGGDEMIERVATPVHVVRIVKNRIKELLDSFGHPDFDVSNLAVAAYLQGFCDCHDGLKIEQPFQPLPSSDSNQRDCTESPAS